MNNPVQHSGPSLTSQAGLPSELEQQTQQAGDDAWIEVIQRMDEIYADLVHSQVALEEKNSQLENAQRFIESILSSMSEILVVCDVSGKILEINQALTECLKRDSKQLINQPISILFTQEFHPLVTDFPQHIRSGSLIDYEVDLLDHKNQSIPMSINCSARFNHEDRLSGMVITGRPLGELRKAYAELQSAHEELKSTQQQLIQSEKMASLGRLVAGVAHELNNPISFIFANMYALKGYHKKFHQYIERIHRGSSKTDCETLRQELRIDKIMDDINPLIDGSMEGVERVSDIVKSLRQFSTPQEMDKQELDLTEVLQRATTWVLSATSTKVEVHYERLDSILLMNKEVYIHQILINLIQNAIDAMQNTHSPKLVLCIIKHKKTVDIVIQDNGNGIDDNDLPNLFDPFFTTKEVGKGTGLGLSISLGLAQDQCQGNLQARNRPNGGAEFIFSLPLGDSK